MTNPADTSTPAGDNPAASQTQNKDTAMAWQNIPDEMKALKQWVCWRMEDREGKPTKLPINPRSRHLASTTDKSTWSTFEQAVRTGRHMNGIGFVFTENDPYIGIDMDGFIDDELVKWFGSYAERSQSGNGCHIIVKGKIEKSRRSNKFEIYASERYFVMTGDVINDVPVSECQDKLAEFYSKEFPAKEPVKPKHDLPLLQPTRQKTYNPLDMLSAVKGAKFDSLWRGDTSDYQGDDSRADAALLENLHWACGGDRSWAESLFRQSGLLRDKTNRKDYMDATWNLVSGGDVYTPPEKQNYEDVDISGILNRMKSRITSTAADGATGTGSDAKTETGTADGAKAKETACPTMEPWKKPSAEAAARAAISGSALETMVAALQQATDPCLPLALTLPKALCLAGCAMSMKMDISEGETSALKLVQRPPKRGVDLAKFIIDTAGGQVGNFYCLQAAESACGKDVGGLVARVTNRMGFTVSEGGSSEGLFDALAARSRNGHNGGFVKLSEFGPYLDKRSLKYRQGEDLNNLFTDGYFAFSMSQRGKNPPPPRESDFCFVNLAANIQPAAFEKYAESISLNSGFLGRFMVSHYIQSGPEAYARQYLDVETLTNEIISALSAITECAGGRIEIPTIDGVAYPRHYGAVFEKFNAPHKMHWKRLVSEYLPRIASILAFDGALDKPPTVTVDHMERANTIIAWFYMMACELFDGVEDSVELRTTRKIKKTLYTAVLKNTCDKRGGIDKRLLFQKLHRTLSDDNKKAFGDLLDRGLIDVSPEKKIYAPDTSILPDDPRLG